MRIHSTLLIIVTALLFLDCKSENNRPTGLRTDLMRNADYVGLMGKKQNFLLDNKVLDQGGYEIAKVQTQKPLFNWILDNRSLKSIAFQILVSSNIKALSKNQGDLWDSGKITSQKFSTYYQGLPLQKNKVYYWKVRYWENDKQTSDYSDPQAFVIDLDTKGEKFSQEPLVTKDEFPVVKKNSEGSYFLDFKKAAFAKLKIQLTTQKEDSILILVGEMKKKNTLTIDAEAGKNIRYYETQIKLNPGTHWYELAWPENTKRSSNHFMI